MMTPRREASHKLGVLKYAEEIGSVVKACRYFGVGRASFYRWKTAYERFGEAGLVDVPSTPKNPVLSQILDLVTDVAVVGRSDVIP